MGRLNSVYELQEDLGCFGKVLILAVGRHQLACFHRLFQIEEEGRFSAKAALDDHVRHQSGAHALGTEFGSTENAVALEDYLRMAARFPAETGKDIRHSAIGL